MTLLAVAEAGRGVVDADTPVLHADDEGVLRGRAVFETIRVYEGVPFRLEEHLARLGASAAQLGLPAVERDLLRAAALDALAASHEPNAVLRLLWTPGREGSGRATGLALVSTLPEDHDGLRARGLRLAVVTWAPGALVAGVKSTSYAENIAAQADAARRGADDALFVDPGGVVLEAPTSNVWWCEGTRLVTPALALPILAGVTRAVLAESLPRLGLELDEGSFPLERALHADEVFLSSSVREVMPVVAIDGSVIGDGRPGPVAVALQRALRTAAGYPEAG